MKSVLVAAAVSTALATTSVAQTAGDQGSEVILSYSNYSSDILPSNVSLLYFGTNGAYNFTPNIGIQYGVGYNRFGLSEGGSSFTLDTVSFEFHGYYQLNGTTKFGVFVSDMLLEQIVLDFGGPSLSIDPDIFNLMYGAEVMTSLGGLDIEAYAGTGKFGGDDLGSTDATVLAYGLDVAYALNSSLTLDAGVNGYNIDVSGGTFKLLTYSVGAEYAFNSNLSLRGYVHGGQIRVDSDGLNMFGYGLGVDYDMPVNVLGGSDMTLYAKVSTTQITPTSGPGSEDVLKYEIGLRWNFGSTSDQFFSGPTLY